MRSLHSFKTRADAPAGALGEYPSTSIKSCFICVNGALQNCRHPTLLLSSGGRHLLSNDGCVILGGGSDVQGSAVQAAVEDPDESVGDLAEGGVVAGPAGADGVVTGAG